MFFEKVFSGIPIDIAYSCPAIVKHCRTKSPANLKSFRDDCILMIYFNLDRIEIINLAQNGNKYTEFIPRCFKY